MCRRDELQSLLEQLVQRRSRIHSALKGDLCALQELSLPSGDAVDCAHDAAFEEVATNLAHVESRELSDIDKALVRFEAGSFGVCDGCEKAIPLARLQAVPYATLCIECQIKLEKSGYSDWSSLQDDAYYCSSPQS